MASYWTCGRHSTCLTTRHSRPPGAQWEAVVLVPIQVIKKATRSNLCHVVLPVMQAKLSHGVVQVKKEPRLLQDFQVLLHEIFTVNLEGNHCILRRRSLITVVHHKFTEVHLFGRNLLLAHLFIFSAFLTGLLLSSFRWGWRPTCVTLSAPWTLLTRTLSWVLEWTLSSCAGLAIGAHNGMALMALMATALTALGIRGCGLGGLAFGLRVRDGGRHVASHHGEPT